MSRFFFDSTSRTHSTRPDRRRRRATGFRPAAELMEGRALLSTLFVDNSGGTQGAYKTIQEAVDAADPGDSIEVYPGTYDGGVVVNKADLTLETVKGPGTVFVVNAMNVGPAFGFDVAAPGDTIRGFDVTGFSSSANAAGIIVGDPTLGRGGSPVNVLASDALIDGNRLDGNANGVLVFQADCVMVHGNSIRDSSGTGDDGNGVWLIAASDATVDGNTIVRSAGAGVRADGGDCDMISNNAVARSAGPGVALNGSDDATASSNDVGRSAGAGIAVNGGGCAMIQGNTVHDGRSDGIAVSGAADPTVSGNSVVHNARNGIAVAGADCPMVADNAVRDSGRDGVAVVDSGGIEVSGNTSRDNAHDGFRVERSSGDVSGNTGRDNAADGFRLVAVAGLNFGGNTATTNRGDGVLVTAADGLTLDSNTSSSNGGSGIHVADSRHVEITGNTADHNTRGIELTDTTDSDASHNSAHGNSAWDLDWDGFGDNTFSDNSADTATPSRGAWGA